ncbi:hypothetical protein F4678DRAFT_340477 [Xylaria arbuscula]|nr:hypothetical protein F4678DRAFT_340477 [Xylaria arbuscula]
MATRFNPLGSHGNRFDPNQSNDNDGKAMMGPGSASVPQVTEVYNKMSGFLKSTHWSKPYYSAMAHNNPQLPYHMLEHVNCTYLSTPGRAPTLLALKQHAQSLAVLISLLAPAQFGGTFEPPNEGKTNGDAPFAAQQAFDWLNNLQEHYNTDDGAHQKPLNALANLVKSNSDTHGPKWHCPLETAGKELPEKHPFPQYRPFETHMTLLMHANEILERLDHEYSAMGGILGIIPLDSEHVEEQRALTQAKTTLVGQWILYTQHLVARMHELEIAYGNSLDLLANEAIVPMQHISIHGPDGRSGREIVFPQDRWIMANAGEDVFTFVHRMLDRAEAQQDAQDEKFAEHKVLGDAAFSSNDEVKYRGIVKADLSTRFYRLRGSGHGPLFVLPAFGDRSNTKHTRDMENRPTVVAIPQPNTKESVNAWESKHQDVDNDLLKLRIDKANLEAKVSDLKSSVNLRDREIERFRAVQKQYDDTIGKTDRDVAMEIVSLQENLKYFQRVVKEGDEREKALKQDLQNFKDANLSVQNQNGQSPINPLVNKINDQQAQIRDLRKEIKEREKKVEELARDNDTLRIINNSPLTKNPSAAVSPGQVAQLRSQLAAVQSERQMLQQEVHNLKKAKTVQGKILNFPESFKFDNGAAYEDTSLGVTACSTAHYKALLEVEKQRNDLRQKLDKGNLDAHQDTADLQKSKAECDRLRDENAELRASGRSIKPAKIINLPWGLKYTSTYRDDNQGLIVLSTEWYDELVTIEQKANDSQRTIQDLEKQISNLKTPAEVNLDVSFEALKKRLGELKAYKDTKSNVAMMTLGYFEELTKAGQAKTETEQQLRNSQNKSTSLDQQLKDAKKQLSDVVQGQSDAATKLPQLQSERDDFEAQLTRALAKSAALEKQLQDLGKNRPPSALESQVLKVQKALLDSKNDTSAKQTELKELQARHDALRLNETNLRSEVTNLRQKLYAAEKAQKAASVGTQTQTVSSGTESEQLQIAKEEIGLYQNELNTLQKHWNTLQTQHVQAQTDLENAQKKADEEKAVLQEKLDETNQTVKVLQIKVLENPNNIKPIQLELEAQRDSARKSRDEMRENVKKMEKKLEKQKKHCEAEKSELRAKLAARAKNK